MDSGAWKGAPGLAGYANKLVYILIITRYTYSKKNYLKAMYKLNCQIIFKTTS